MHTIPYPSDTFMFILLIGTLFVSLLFPFWQKRRIKKAIHNLSTAHAEITPRKLMALRSRKVVGLGNKFYAREFNFTGVYILHNVTKDKHFVGSSMTVLDQSIKHFKGSGNGAVYQDYKQGDQFNITMLALSETNHKSLDAMRKNMISAHKAYSKGYNRTSTR